VRGDPPGRSVSLLGDLHTFQLTRSLYSVRLYLQGPLTLSGYLKLRKIPSSLYTLYTPTIKHDLEVRISKRLIITGNNYNNIPYKSEVIFSLSLPPSTQCLTVFLLLVVICVQTAYTVMK
jgi:hypothetical protein